MTPTKANDSLSHKLPVFPDPHYRFGKRFLHSEISLYRILKKHFPDAKHEYGPAWLGRQRFDIFLPSLKVAAEYNGAQHYQPLELFGEEEGLRKTRKRDELKKNRAKENGIVMFEWPHTRNVNEHEVSIFLEELERTRDVRLACP